MARLTLAKVRARPGKRYHAPKAIVGHPAVEACLSAVEGGATDYKHDVWLKAGFEWASGRNEGGRGMFFHSVADFRSVGIRATTRGGLA